MLVLIVALLCEGIWWFMRPKIAAPEKTAEAPIPAKVSVTAPIKIEAPKPVAPSTPKPDAAPVADTPPPDVDADPQADLKTAIPDIARLKRSGDFLTIYENYTPPDKLNPQTIQTDRIMAKRIADGAANDPRLKQITQRQNESVARAYEALESQAPTYNETGDEATYMYLAPPELVSGSVPYPMTFVKINGKWYIKPPDVQGTVTFASPPGAH